MGTRNKLYYSTLNSKCKLKTVQNCYGDAFGLFVRFHKFTRASLVALEITVWFASPSLAGFRLSVVPLGYWKCDCTRSVGKFEADLHDVIGVLGCFSA